MRSRMPFAWRQSLWSETLPRRSRKSCRNFPLLLFLGRARMRDAWNRRRRQAYFFLWAMVALYAGARVLQLFTAGLPMLAVLGMHILPALAFALVHGTMQYRLRNSIAFLLFFLVIGNLME